MMDRSRFVQVVSLTSVAAVSYISNVTGKEAVHRKLASVLKTKAGLLRVVLGNYSQITSFVASRTAASTAAPEELGRTLLQFARVELLREGDQQDGLCLLAIRRRG